MKKIAILCIFIMLMGALPIYAADSNSITPIQDFQAKWSQMHQQIHAKLAELKSTDPQKFQQVKDLIAKIKLNRKQIKQNKIQIHALEKNKTQNQGKINDLRNQNKDLRNQNKDIIKQILGILGL